PTLSQAAKEDPLTRPTSGRTPLNAPPKAPPPFSGGERRSGLPAYFIELIEQAVDLLFNVRERCAGRRHANEIVPAVFKDRSQAMALDGATGDRPPVTVPGAVEGEHS